MKKTNIVKSNNEFQNIINHGYKIQNNIYILYIKENELSKYRFGVSVGKKIGNAVTRNKYKRKIRSIIDNNKKLYENNKDYIIIIKKSCLDKTYQELEKSFIMLFNK